ncbi:MAG: response regulator transcription factor [Bacteroidales bacterium]|jgi:DNA-binding LytR/AlgR family response regulator|nr:response regulator transcription factor [Bacteroidales bacterium]
MIFKCAIIDDEFLARQYLKDYVSKVPFLKLTGDYDSPLLAIEDLKNNNFDLLFLDIQMPDISGLEFLKTINPQPFVIFTTAYKKYALEGYEHNTIDYLLKPISFERFLKAVNKLNDLIQIGKAESGIVQSEKQPTDYLTVRADRKLYKVSFDDLIFIEGQQAYVTFITRERKITALMSMKDLEKTLPQDRFIRIHKSYIASRKYISSLDGNQIEINGQKLPVGKIYREQVQKLFNIK